MKAFLILMTLFMAFVVSITCHQANGATWQLEVYGPQKEESYHIISEGETFKIRNVRSCYVLPEVKNMGRRGIHCYFGNNQMYSISGPDGFLETYIMRGTSKYKVVLRSK